MKTNFTDFEKVLMEIPATRKKNKQFYKFMRIFNRYYRTQIHIPVLVSDREINLFLSVFNKYTQIGILDKYNFQEIVEEILLEIGLITEKNI